MSGAAAVARLALALRELMPPRESRPPIAPPPAAAPRAWVVFCGDTQLGWLRLLKPGFRHCFLAINDGRHWLTLDPLAAYTELAVQPVPPAFNLPDWYRGRGYRVVPAVLRHDHARPAPWAPLTCVESVKRALGLHDRWILTPYQLYRRLTVLAAGG